MIVHTLLSQKEDQGIKAQSMLLLRHRPRDEGERMNDLIEMVWIHALLAGLVALSSRVLWCLRVYRASFSLGWPNFFYSMAPNNMGPATYHYYCWEPPHAFSGIIKHAFKHMQNKDVKFAREIANPGGLEVGFGVI